MEAKIKIIIKWGLALFSKGKRLACPHFRYIMILLLCSNVFASQKSQTISSFQKELNALKDDIEDNIISYLQRQWTIDFVSYLEKSGYTQEQIQKTLVSQKYKVFLNKAFEQDQTRQNIQNYLQNVLSEKKLLQNIQNIKKKQQAQLNENMHSNLKKLYDIQHKSIPRQKDKNIFQIFLSHIQSLF